MAQSDSTSTKKPAARGGIPGFVFLIATTVVLALIFVFYWPQKSPMPPRVVRPPKPPDAVALLERRLGYDEQRIKGLEQVSRNLDALSLRVARLEQAQPTALASPSAPLPVPAVTPQPSLDAYALKSDEDALAARVAKLEARDTGDAVRSAAAALALANLARASEGAGNFSAELHTLTPLMPDAPEAQDLAHYARGVEPESVLAARFPQVAAAAIAADRRANAKGWLERLWVNLSSLVSIRRVGDVAGNDTESKLARASANLKSGDLPGAVAQTRTVDGAAQQATAPWLADAQARLAVDHDMRALSDRLVASLSAGSQK